MAVKLIDMTSKKVVITGSTGFIGAALAQSLRSDGHEVLGVSRTAGSDTVVWDVDAGTIDSAAIEGADAIVHLAGETIDGRWTKAKKQRLISSRVESTRLLADAIARLDTKPSVFVAGSAMGYYGDRGDDLLDESAAAGTGFLPDLVVAWEAAAEPIAAAGVRVPYARTSLVLGPGGVLPRLRTITKFGAGGPLGNGKQWMSWISLADEVRALRHLIDADIEGPVNLATDSPVQQRAFAKLMGQVLRRPSFMPAPAFAIKLLLGQMGEELLLASTRLQPGVLRSSGFEFDDPDLEGTLRNVL